MVDGITRGKPFDLLPDLTFDEYRSQEVLETNDGVFFRRTR